MSQNIPPLVDAIDRLTLQAKRIADTLEKRPQGSGAGAKPVECYVCKNAGKSVMIRLKRKLNPVEGQSPFELHNLDWTPHVHVGAPAKQAPPKGDPNTHVPPTTPPAPPPANKPDSPPPTATANLDQLMNYLNAIWPKGVADCGVTDCGDYWKVPSPYLESKDWKELATAIRTELHGEYVSDKAEHDYYFKIPKPRPKA